LRKNRQLLAQLLVKGDSYISSAAISQDGTLLVAATNTDIKAFVLDFESEKGQARIKKVDIPTSGVGATRVQLSPDGQWISWVEEGNRVMISRVNVTEAEDGFFTYAISHPRRLTRIRRQIPKNLLLGGLGSYDRNITQITFSPDSKMLGVADLAGYIDTWILRGPGEATNGVGGGEDDDDASDSSSDSSDEESDDHPGERWVRNPRGKLLPKLSAAPVVLSFCNAATSQEDGDYDLLVITALKTLLVFNPLRGALSEWSRRNPYHKLPAPFRDTRDQVKGVVWQGQRAWIYGVSSLFMLDLSRDFAPEQAQDATQAGQKQGVKRKRDGRDAGAGGKMEKHSLAAQRLRTAAAPDGSKWEDVEMADADDQKSAAGASSSGVEDDDYDDDDDYDEEEEEETDGGELQRLRNSELPMVNGHASAAGEKRGDLPRARWWHTYQFRPILGIVPLGDGVSGEAVGERRFAGKVRDGGGVGALMSRAPCGELKSTGRTGLVGS
jgi:U3 small nucleolar RNA-associated protein 4